MAGRLSNHVVGVSIKEENKGDNSSGGGDADHEHHRSRKEEINIVSKVGTKRKEIDEMLNSISPKQKGLSNKQVVDATKTERSSVEGPNLIASSSSPLKNNDDYHELQSAKAEMGKVREENQRLRMYLDQITKDYHTLQMQLNAISQQADPSRSKDTINIPQPKFDDEQPEFVSLSLGRTASMDSKKRDEMTKSKLASTSSSKLEQERHHGNLSLGLDCKFDQEVSKMRSPPRDHVSQHPTINISSPDNSSFDEPRDQETSETKNWPPSKVAKTMSNVEHGEISQPSTNVNPKKARVSVRARCDTPTMNDGCQWRKYGQKISKGNPCPRAYYRCTVAPSCPVRKQVQRCAQDMSILITTYEGTHNHPLPIAATAMASTTSAAATMLLSGSSTSRSGLLPSTSTTTGDQLHGLNFYLSDNSKPNQFYYSNPSIQSSASSCPTITLDLTSSSSTSSAFSSHFSKLPNYPPPTQRYSSLNFSSLESSNTLPISWSNGQLTYGANNNVSTQPSYNNTNNIIGSMNLGARQQVAPLQENGNLYQSFMQKNNNIDTSHSSNTIKAITSDPSFQSALAAALTSIIGGGNNNHNLGGLLLGENSTLGQKLKWGENRPGSSSNNVDQPAAAAASLMLLPPSSSSTLPFSRSKSASTSPDESRDHEDI